MASSDITPPAEAPATEPAEEERPARRFRGSGASAAERDRMLKELRRIEFPAALRGYDRSSVDAYVEQVNRLIAELEISASPESAVRHALEEVSEETRGLLQRAHQTADEIVGRARLRAEEQLAQAESDAGDLRDGAERDAAQVRESSQQDARELSEAARREAAALRDEVTREAAELRETVAREAAESREATARESARLHGIAQREADALRESARREAEQMLEAAQARERELALSADTIWRERRRLIEDVRNVGDQLVAIGESESKRFAHFPETVGDAEADAGAAGTAAVAGQA